MSTVLLFYRYKTTKMLALSSGCERLKLSTMHVSKAVALSVGWLQEQRLF